MTAWNCVKTIIENEMFATPEDMGHLMEVMSVIAKIMTDPGEDDLKKRVVKFKFKDAKTIWNCLNIAMNEEMIPKHRMGTAAEAMGFLAIELDLVVASHGELENVLDGTPNNSNGLEVGFGELNIETFPGSED